MRRRNPASTQQSSLAHREMLLRPPKKTALQKTKDFIWDSKNKTCLTRTPVNWISITVYYLLFLAGIIAIFAISLSVAYFMTMKENRPQYILDESPIGCTPALNFFPMNGSRPLIWLSSHLPFEKYVDSINKVIRSLKEKNSSFDMTQYGECSNAPFGYNSSPCVFVRMNRVLMWEPVLFKKGDKFPEEMPEDVKASINGEDESKVWLSCEGSTAKDKDMLNETAFEIQGPKGFFISAFPYAHQSGYIDPMVAIKLNADFIPKKVILTFTCTYWAKNIDNKTASVDVNIYFE